MKIHYVACALSSSLDAATNQLSLFHILDEIRGPAFPLALPSFCVAALFEREAVDSVVQPFVLAVHLDAALLASFSMSVDFTASRRNRSVNTIRGLTIAAPGLVTISFLQKSRVLAEWRAMAVTNGDRAAATKPVAQPGAAAEPPAEPAKGAAILN